MKGRYQQLLKANYFCGMKRQIIRTSDGSNTIHVPELNENYHSGHGALVEAQHVFVRYGLDNFVTKKDLKIFEMGFGTGLNAILTYRWATKHDVDTTYFGIEAYPVSNELVQALNYSSFFENDEEEVYAQMHGLSWDISNQLKANFNFIKSHNRIENIVLNPNEFDIIFFDAFGPRVDPELWSVTIMQKMFDTLKEDGILVTYCAQGQFKRNLKSVGFSVVSPPGPPGKREMTVGVKGSLIHEQAFH